MAAFSRSRTRDDAATGEPRLWLRRVPWFALAVSIAVLLSSGLAVQPIRDAVTGTDVAEAYLVKPVGYLLLAPVSGVLDTMTLMSLHQHIALFAGLMVLFLLARAVLAWRRRSTWRAHLASFATVLVTWMAATAAAALLPRPMASLATDNANVVRADFHSHTDASHDTRQTVEENLSWHRGGGFDAAYITDHYSVRGAERAVAANPPIAGQGTILLQSIETAWNGEHVSILGAERTFKGLMTPNLRDVDTLALRIGSTIPGREPVVIWNHPRQFDRLPLATGPGTGGIRAIEIVNGGPRDIDRVVALRSRIIGLARDSNLALTTGTDNHGWGRAVPGWTLLRIFNWRAMPPDEVGTQIEAILRNGGFGATRVVERRVADPRHHVWASVFSVPWRMLTTLSNDERVVWLMWIWLITAGAWFWRRRRERAGLSGH